MSNVVLSLVLKDTLSPEPTAGEIDAVIANLSKQLLALADKVRTDQKAIYEYLSVTQPYAPNKPVVDVVSNNQTKPENHQNLMIDRVFENLKRTEKSVRIVQVFINNSGNDITLEQLVDETGLSRPDICSWLSQTGKKIKGITYPSRGIYKFDPDKL